VLQDSARDMSARMLKRSMSLALLDGTSDHSQFGVVSQRVVTIEGDVVDDAKNKHAEGVLLLELGKAGTVSKTVKRMLARE
jgi:hypothetical protein